MAIIHELASIFFQDVGKDFVWVLVAREGEGIGFVLANTKNIQN